MRFTNRAIRYGGSARHQIYAVLVGLACLVEGTVTVFSLGYLETDIRWNLITSEMEDWVDGNISFSEYLRSIKS